MINHRRYNRGVLTFSFLFSLGGLTQGLLYNDVYFTKMFSMMLLVTIPTFFKYYMIRKQKVRVFKIFLLLSVTAVILGALFDSGIVSCIFSFTGLWVAHLFFEEADEM